MRIIGITGTIGSGKGTVASLIEKRRYFKLSFGGEVAAFVKEDLSSRGPLVRERLQFWGNEARLVYGDDFWERRLFEKIKAGKNYVVEGFRYPDQIANFQERYGAEFFSVGVDSFREVRFERMKNRTRDGDPRNWQEFLEMERRDLEGYKAGVGQNTRDCMKIAGTIIYNNGTLDELEERVEEFLKKLKIVCA